MAHYPYTAVRPETLDVETAPRMPRRRGTGTHIVWYGVLAIVSAVVLLPAWWVVVTSLTAGNSSFQSSFWPSPFTTANYGALWHSDFPHWIVNSLIVAIATGLLNLIITALAAYAFSRMSFWGRRLGIIAVFIIQIFPASMYLVSIYSLLIKVNLEGTLIGLILVYSGASAFNIWLLTAYINSVPREIDEAARVDGATRGTVFWRIILPLARPMLVTLFIWSVLGTYNEFMVASLVLQGNPATYTVAVGLRTMVSGTTGFSTNWTLFAAGAVVATFPLLIVFLALQRQLVAGLSRGAVNS
jgi:arabinogalactan oligomer/maltooligosaccharide transport system permease protein